MCQSFIAPLFISNGSMPSMPLRKSGLRLSTLQIASSSAPTLWLYFFNFQTSSRKRVDHSPLCIIIVPALGRRWLPKYQIGQIRWNGLMHKRERGTDQSLKMASQSIQNTHLDSLSAALSIRILDQQSRRDRSKSPSPKSR